MKILVTGLCTLHWGRLEHGNVGNYYIIEPLFRELHRVFPDAEIATTFQMTEDFVKKENIIVYPMEYYYSWNENDLSNSLKEFAIANYFNENNIMIDTTPYIELVSSCDLVLDISGDMWGDYAEHVGHNRFLIDLLKMRTAQLLKCKTVLFAGSQGPFSESETYKFAKTVYENFTAVIAREPQAVKNVEKYGFDTKNTRLFACPAFIFEPKTFDEIRNIMIKEGITIEGEKIKIGFTICGFNMDEQPYDKWPREDEEFEKWINIIEHIIITFNAQVVLVSHSNGFELPPKFKKIPGRDYPILNKLKELIILRQNVNVNDVICIDGAYEPSVVKGIIGQMDMMIAGRVHSSVAAISQQIPTVFIPYTEKMNSTKMLGFASLSGMQEYVTSTNEKNIILKIDKCWNDREKTRSLLKERVPVIRDKVHDAFDYLRGLV